MIKVLNSKWKKPPFVVVEQWNQALALNFNQSLSFSNKNKMGLSVLSKDATSKTPRVAQKSNITFVSQRQMVDAGLQWRLKPFILMPICSWFTILKMFFFVFSSQFCSLTPHNIPNNGLCFMMRIYSHTQFCVLFYLWLGTFFFHTDELCIILSQPW